jgi:BCD family chlorophyll transporter-like MFS transporter
MPFALLILSGDTTGPIWIGQAAAALAFLLVGAGLHTVQTVGLALATDLAPERARPRVVALLCAMLLAGMAVSALAFGVLLAHFSEVCLIQVVQGAAVATMVLNGAALWKQEPRMTGASGTTPARTDFFDAWNDFATAGRTRRRLIATALGTAGFSMQDILLEPYGGKILHLPVGATTALTAMLALGGGAGLVLAARRLTRGADPHRVAGFGALVGIIAFACVVFAAPLDFRPLFGLGGALIGLGGGLFAHGTLTASMTLAKPEDRGLALGAWGAAQATAAGLAIAFSGVVNDLGSSLAIRGAFGEALADPVTGYALVYSIEILLLLTTLVAIGPLVRFRDETRPIHSSSFGAPITIGLSSGG